MAKITATAVAQPWEQQPSDTPKSWEAFLVYRELGFRRSHQKVADELGKSRALISRWASQHSWLTRALAWDREQDRVWQREVSARQTAAARRNANLAEALLTKAAQALKAIPIAQVEAKDVARLVDTAARLERQALGLPSETVQHQGPNGGPIQHVDMSKLSDEDRLERLAELNREISKRLAAANQLEED